MIDSLKFSEHNDGVTDNFLSWVKSNNATNLRSESTSDLFLDGEYGMVVIFPKYSRPFVFYRHGSSAPYFKKLISTLSDLMSEKILVLVIHLHLS